MRRTTTVPSRVQEFGRYVSARRAFLGLSQEAVAQACDMNRGHLSDLERGEKIPSLETIWRLADALKLSAGDLVDGRNLTARPAAED